MAQQETLKMNAPVWRYAGSRPKIGIRPTIDGRYGGPRENLENQTMAMAKSAAALIAKKVRHADGAIVECVIADTCIGGVAEAAACQAKFEREGVGATLTVTPCWCYGSETMDTDPLTPKAIWGFNGTERPGAVYLAAVLAAHNQMGLPAFSIYGQDVQDANDTSIPADVEAKILRFARAAIATATMRGRSYLSMGYTSMGIAGSIVNPDFFRAYLGMRTEFIDLSEMVRRIDRKIFDETEWKRAHQWVKANCVEGEDVNPKEKQESRGKKDANWETVVKMALIARDMMIGNPRLAEMGFLEEARGHNALLGGFQGQRHWTDHSPNGDFLEAMLNSSFDWNGIREPFIVATENDSLNGVAMLFGKLLTGSAQVFADVRTYWSPDAVKRVTGKPLTGDAAPGLIHLINSGAAALDGSGRQTIGGKPAMKPWWEITPAEAAACLDATKWCPADLPYFPGGGFSSQFLSRGGMPVTMARVNLVKGLGPVLQIAEGMTVDLPKDQNDILERRTSPTWPTTWFVPRVNGKGAFRDVYTVMANWGANHGSFSYGHIGGDLIALASMLRIPVCMHNVAESDLYRPTAWGAFGMDGEGSDFRACGVYGPIYGKM